MINVWDYANKLPYVKVETIDGEVFKGDIIHVMDKEEADYPDDGIFIESRDGGIKLFLQSQLKSVDVIK